MTLPCHHPTQTRIRQRCLAWILAHRPRRYWLARIEDTPAAVWRNLGRLNPANPQSIAPNADDFAGYAAQLAIICLPSAALGALFGLAF